MNGGGKEDLQARLERLPEQIQDYYRIYFSELRGASERFNLFAAAVPDFLKGYKRVVSIGGKDGLVVAHFPIELEITVSATDTGKVLIRFPSVLDAEDDTFEFITFPESPVRDLVAVVSGGEEEIGADVASGPSWGSGAALVFAESQQKVELDTGQLAWQAPWTRLVIADFNHLHFWEDTERAKREAWVDLKPYIRGLEHKELDELRAPENIEEAGIKAGDRGVVLEVFEYPSPALLVEYTDLLGQTKALVNYSKDLEAILDVFVDRDFLRHHERDSESSETVRGQTFDFSPPSRVVEGLLVSV